MKKDIILIFYFLFIKVSFCQLNTTLEYHWQDTSLIGSFAYNNIYNEIWGLEVNGNEFAVIGSTSGTHIFDITNTSSSYESAFIPGSFTGGGVIHRDYHDYAGYLYIVCDEGSSSTLKIVDISNLPSSVNTVFDSNNLFTNAHNIFIDTATAKLYVCAVKHTNPNNFSSAMEIYSLANPVNPVLLYTYNNVGHVHDSYVRNDTAYLNCGYDGLRIVDFSTIGTTTPVSPTELASLPIISYPDGGYNHSGWLNDDGTIYAMQDENHGYDIKIFDVSDFNNIQVLSVINSGVDTNSMAHNGIIKGDYLYVAYYHDGLRVFDISNPVNPIQVNYYDTYLPTDHISYRGSWGVYPYLKSGNILVSDMQTGLYVLKCHNTQTSTQQEHIKNILIYPNPSSKYLYINKYKTKSLNLYNLFGESVLELEYIKENIIYLPSSITSGIYIYKVIDYKGISSTGKLYLTK
ncbi:MAG: choice-of-anchor B family protein [Bacteroidota bacterium]|nr:choice-of-anchor B family protein [Bacteroidota bacterium]